MKVKRRAKRPVRLGGGNRTDISEMVRLFAEYLGRFTNISATKEMFRRNGKLKLTDVSLSLVATETFGIEVTTADIVRWRSEYNTGRLFRPHHRPSIPSLPYQGKAGSRFVSTGTPDTNSFAKMIASFHDDDEPDRSYDDDYDSGDEPIPVLSEPDVDDLADSTPLIPPAKSRADWIKEVKKKRAVSAALKRIKNEKFHRDFYKALTNGLAGLNTLLVGPTQCGKSELISQIGRAMGRKFGSLSCTSGTSETHLTGYLLPIGESGRFEFIETEFIRLFEGGGVFLFDEMDAADPNMLLVISQAFSQGVIPLPKRYDKPYAKKHPKFVAYASANTWGSGADRDYVGRNQLDAATLARFQCGIIPMDYDEELESHLCPDEDLRLRLTIYRRNMREKKVRRWITTRFMAEAYRMKTDWGWDDAMIDETLFGGWTEVEISKVKGEFADGRPSTW